MESTLVEGLGAVQPVVLRLQSRDFSIQQRRDFNAHTCGGYVEMPRQQNERDFGQALDNWLLIESSGRAGFNAW